LPCSGSMSRPPKTLAAAVGRWELFGRVRIRLRSHCGSDTKFWPLLLKVNA